MTQYTCLATAAFGLEGLVAGELRAMGFIDAKAENGGARFTSDLAGVARANLWLGCADRVLIVLGEFPATSFDMLFTGVQALELEALIDKNAAFPVKGKCVRSRLMSVRDCQAITKKAASERLKQAHRVSVLPETGALCQLEISVTQDMARLTLDASGEALNRRGYRVLNGAAAIRETLARALLLLSPWHTGEPLMDPCCGTGTFLCEAAMLCASRAPGLTRDFAMERWPTVPRETISRLRQEAQDAFHPERAICLSGGDIDDAALDMARVHLKRAGFSDRVRVAHQDLRDLYIEGSGFLIANPPYGERLGDKTACRSLYRLMGRMLARCPNYGMGVITSDTAFERCAGLRAERRRRLYNGRLECEYMLFHKKGASQNIG